MATGNLNVVIDTSEPRIQRDRIVCLVDGRHWDLNPSLTTCFVDGITRTAFLTPLYYTPEWQTTTTGLYARLGKADYTFDLPPFVAEGSPPPYPDGVPQDASKWAEDPVAQVGHIYMTAQGVNDRAITNQRFPKNRPFLLSWFAYNSGQTRQVQIECGWLSEEIFIGLRIWTDGKCDIFKNGIQVGGGSIFERHVTTQTVYGKEKTTGSVKPKHSKGSSRQMQDEFVDLLLIPCRRRDLLLLSNKGGGFRFSFEDLDPDNPDNTITPDNARFLWQVPAGQAKVLCAPLNFQTSGDLVSIQYNLTDAPGGSETPTVNAFTDQPGYGAGDWSVSLLEGDASGVFVPDGDKNQVRVLAHLDGDGTSTPFLYGASDVYDAILANTDSDHETDVTPFVLSADLSVPENSGDVSFKVTCREPQGMEDAGAVDIRTVGNRAAECAIGPFSFMSGKSKSPAWTMGVDDVSSRVMLEFRDRCKTLEEYRIKVATPYDGLELSEAMTQIVAMSGYSRDDIDIPVFGFNLPTIGQSSEGEFALYPEVGDKAIDWFTRLWETFARHTQWGWVPTVNGPKFQVRTLDELDAGESQQTLYLSTADALADGVDPAFAPYWVIRSFASTRIECEANEIYVLTRDPRTGSPFAVRWRDLASQDPTLAPAQRPKNWLGEPRVYSWVDPSLAINAAASWVVGTLSRRLAVARDVIAFDSFFLIRPDGAPVWKGDKVTIAGVGDVRITTFSGKFDHEYVGDEPSKDRLWRPFKYTGELVSAPPI